VRRNESGRRLRTQREKSPRRAMEETEEGGEEDERPRPFSFA